MTPEEWPIWTPPERGSLPPALRAGRDRLPTVRSDFFLDPDFRLTEQERALITAMLHRLVADIAAEIQAALPEDWLPANEDYEELINLVSRAGFVDIEDVMALVLRRADEERVASACQARSSGPAGNVIQPFVSDPDAEIASAAMAVLIGRGRRRDRFGRVILELDDIPPGTVGTLVFGVAAGLRHRLPVHIGASEAERRLCGAALELIRAHDRSRALDSQIWRLVDHLGNGGRIDDELVRKAIDLADVGFLVPAIARRAGLDPVMAFNELMSCESRRVMAVLRLAGVSRSIAAHLVGSLGDLIGLPSTPHSLDPFDSLTPDQLEAVRTWLQLHTEFQIALRALGHGNGHRTI